MKLQAAIAALALMSAVCVVQAADVVSIPVMVGGNDTLDACDTLSQIEGLDPAGDGFLAVRGGPGTGFALLDRLKAGQRVFVCTETADGRWLSVVYPRAGQDVSDCEVSTPIKLSTKYTGPCASGWAASRWVKPAAG